VPYRISWQEWIANLNVDSVFYDTSEQHKGLNQHSSRFSGVSGYDIRIMLEAKVSDPSGITTYRSISPATVINDSIKIFKRKLI
jgi:hypothetical protein